MLRKSGDRMRLETAAFNDRGITYREYRGNFKVNDKYRAILLGVILALLALAVGIGLGYLFGSFVL